MSCCCNQELRRLLVNICRMQKEAVREEIQEEMCDGRLGHCATLGRAKFNTRPLEVYTDDDKAWACPVDREDVFCNGEGHEKSCAFRIEKVDGDLATFRALVKVEEHGECGDKKAKFKPTSSFKSIKICDISAIRCLKDTFVNLCIR